MNLSLPSCARCGSARSSSVAEVEPCQFCGAPPTATAPPSSGEPEPGWRPEDLGRRRIAYSAPKKEPPCPNPNP